MNSIIDWKITRVLLIMAFIGLTILCLPVFFGFIDKFSTVIYPLIFAMGLAYLIHQLAKSISRKLHIKSINLCALLVIIFLLLYFTLLLLFVIPQLITTFNIIGPAFMDLINHFTEWAASMGFNLTGLIDWNQVKEWISTNSQTILNYTTSAISSTIEVVAAVIVWFFMFLLVVFDFKAIGKFWGKYWNRETAGKYSKYFQATNEKMRNMSLAYIKIVAIDSLALISLFAIIGLPGAFALGLLGGVLALIPYFGPFILGFIAVLVGFSVSPLTAILALVVMAIWPIIDGNLIQPKILSDAFKVKPAVILLVMISLMIACGPFMGIVIAYPTTVFISTAYENWKNKNNLI